MVLGCINLKIINTSSKYGHGCFQTVPDKAAFMNLMKKGRVREEVKATAVAKLLYNFIVNNFNKNVKIQFL